MITQQDLRRGGPMHGFRLNPRYMSRTTIEGFMREFPWVEKYVWGTIAEAYVEEIEPFLLGRFPEPINSGFLGPFYEKLILLTENGEEVFIETLKERSFGFFKLKPKKEKIFGRVAPDSTISVTIRQFGEKINVVRFILSFHTCTRAIILYKLPNGTSLLNMLEKEIEREHQKFHALT